MNLAFILSRVEDARLIKGVALERGHKVAIYEKPEELLSLNFIPDCVVVELTSIDERDREKMRIIFASAQNILFILPFWVNASRKIEELREACRKLGIKKRRIKVIKKPFTTEELIRYVEVVFQKR